MEFGNLAGAKCGLLKMSALIVQEKDRDTDDAVENEGGSPRELQNRH